MSTGVNLLEFTHHVGLWFTTYPAFMVFVAGFLMLGLLENWRPFFTGREEPGSRLLTNFSFGIINAAIQAILPITILLAAVWAEGSGFGLLHWLALPNWLASVLTILTYSLTAYWLHRISHSLPLLWRLHRVHHADTHLDLSTGLRNHPLELAIPLVGLSTSAVLLGMSPVTIAVYQIAAAIFGIWDHANLRLPARLDGVMRLLFVTPQMHHVHHSSEQHQTDSNYGDVFSFWDRLFGTYCHMTPEQIEAMRIGLGDRYDADAASLLGQLAAPARS